MNWLIGLCVIAAGFVGFAVACLACAADCDTTGNPQPCPQCRGAGWIEDHGDGWGPPRTGQPGHGFTTRLCPGCRP